MPLQHSIQYDPNKMQQVETILLLLLFFNNN